MKKLNIAVLYGGQLSEYKISLASGGEVIKNLDPKKYEVTPVLINESTNLFSIKNFDNENIDVCFIALHGAFGEDGKIQAILEYLKIPYTGSGVLASALGMDKIRSRQLFAHNNLTVPQTIVINKGDEIPTIKLPAVVKPNDQGSSVGVFIVKTKQDLNKAIKKVFELTSCALVEEYLQGTEVTCAVLGNDKLEVLPVIEIVPKKEFFDLEAKYDANLCDEIVPARISKKLTQEVQESTLKAYRILGCRGFGRVDAIIKDDKVYVLEMNTIPGMTPNSLLPKAANAANISFPKLLDKIISLTLHFSAQ